MRRHRWRTRSVACCPTSLVVASAGNNASCRPYFPAALPNVVAVGGLDSGGRAAFSNFGPWVDACAPAVDVVSTFFIDYDDVIDAASGLVNEYRGWATWSGTSFAAPKVAAVVAQELYLQRRHGRRTRGLVWRATTSSATPTSARSSTCSHGVTPRRRRATMVPCWSTPPGTSRAAGPWRRTRSRSWPPNAVAPASGGSGCGCPRTPSSTRPVTPSSCPSWRSPTPATSTIGRRSSATTTAC